MNNNMRILRVYNSIFEGCRDQIKFVYTYLRHIVNII